MTTLNIEYKVIEQPQGYDGWGRTELEGWINSIAELGYELIAIYQDHYFIFRKTQDD